MYIALEKKKTNIAEYILYMWQIENIIRASKFNIETIENTVIKQLGIDDNEKSIVSEWYADLMKKMKSEGVTKKGHLSELKDHVAELNLLHQTLLSSFQDNTYNMLYNDARADINDLMKKQVGVVNNEIEASLNGLYGLWLLRLTNKEVSNLTLNSLQKISKLIARLAKNYHEMMNAAQSV